MQTSQRQKSHKTRYVSEHGEVLIVRKCNGVKALTDPCDADVTVVVPTGRRANLVRFAFCGLRGFCGRDAHVAVNYNHQRGLCFSAVRYPAHWVALQDLPEGQRVDVLPAAEPAAAYAVVLQPLPVFHGAATAVPVYAAVAA